MGYIGPKSAVPVLLEGLKKLEYRGYDSAGLAVIDGDTLHLRRVKGKISGLEESLRKSPLKGNYGLGHTRWATHGRPTEENAHPHQDCTRSLVIVHNGIIENYLELKKRLGAVGHSFRTETDTEVIAHLIEEYFEGSLEEATRRAIGDLRGAFAIAAISTRDPLKIVVARQGPPVAIGLGHKEYILSSDINAIISHTKDVVFLEDGEMAVLEPAGVRFSDFSGKPIKKKPEHLTWDPLMIEKRGFKHFMLKEIFEQPQVVRDTLLGRISLASGKVDLDEVSISPLFLKGIQRVAVIACGTSYHAALVGKYLIEAIAKIPVDVEYASEFRYRDFILERQTLVIFISQSGETADTLSALRVIDNSKARTLAITNVLKSSIAREADGVLYTHAGPEIGVAATKTFSAQLTALALVALRLAQLRGRIDKKTSLSLVQELQRIPHKMETLLSEAKGIEETALNFVSFSQFLFLGRWINYPLALEGALKLKEISYVHAEGYPGGEMKHGPIALIDEKMPTVAIVPKDRVYEKTLSNISEIKARSGYVLGIAFRDDLEIRKSLDAVIPIPPTDPLLTPFLTILPLQLFAYYIAAAKGADVDQPRNLAKSVTVE
jgi:glucosamine--fructose-6-phosphate aminotransferase (isomerizing)